MSRTTRPEVLEARTRAQQALRLRMSGATLQEVADRLGFNSRQAVWKATTSLLERQEREATAEWQALQLARLERLLLAVWQDALDGDNRAGQQALRILQELGKLTGVSGPRRVETSGSAPATESLPALANMSEAEWARRYEIAQEQVLASCPDGRAAGGHARIGGRAAPRPVEEGRS